MLTDETGDDDDDDGPYPPTMSQSFFLTESIVWTVSCITGKLETIKTGVIFNLAMLS